MKQSSLISEATLSTLGILAQGLSRFFFSVLVGRLAGEHVLAVTTGWLSMSIILSLFWPTGAGNVTAHLLAQARAGRYSPARVVSRMNASVWPVIAAMALIGSFVAFVWLSASPADLPAIALVTIGYSGWVYTRGILMGLGEVGRAAVLDLVSSVVSVGLLVIVLVIGDDALLVGTLGTGYTLFTVAAGLLARKRTRSHRSGATPSTSVVVGTTAWSSAGLLASNGLIQIVMIYVVAVSPTAGAGQFAAAISLATPASMLAQALSQVLIPRFSHSAAFDGAASSSGYRVALAGVAVVLAVVFGAGVALSPLAITIVYGPSYAGAVPLMQLLLVAMYFFSLVLIASSYLLSTHRVRLSTICSAVGTLIGVVLLVALTGPLGAAPAAALGALVGYGIAAVLSVAASLVGRQPDRARASEVTFG